MVARYKVPFPQIKTRSTQSSSVMQELSNGTPPWSAPDFMSPGNFLNLLQALTTQENTVSLEEAALAIAAGAWDNILDPWHKESVTVLKIGRVKFAGTEFAPSWARCKANGGGRERITRQGTDIGSAWKKSDQAWVPKTGLTFATFEARRTTAAAKALLYSDADKAAANERGLLITEANAIYDLCVQWYEMATATFAPDTPQGILIRTIPTNYNPDQAPGQLRFPERYSPAPGNLVLKWGAARGEHFNIYGKAPGSDVFQLLLENVTVKEWVAQGLTPGVWAFKGEATNADGLGEMSEVIIVPIMAAQAA